MNSLGRLFACPLADERQPQASRLLRQNVEDYLFGFLHRRAAAIRAKSEGLVELLQAIAGEEKPWDVGLGFPSRPLSENLELEGADHVHLAALIAGHFHGLGRRGTWTAELSSPRAVRFGRSVTPPVASLSVDGDRIEYRNERGTSDRMRELGLVAIDERRSLWIAGAEDVDLFGLETVKGFSSAPLREREAELEEAVRLTRAHAPEYLAWYGDVVRVIASWPPSAEKTVQSGSKGGQHGIVYASSPQPSIRLAETLVHEASHQHFHYAQLEIAFHRLDDDSTYWSPYPKKNRYIDRILLAYHAFANVVLFYRRVLESATDPEVRSFGAYSIEQQLPMLRDFDRHLCESKGLTAHGRAMWQTLSERLAL